MIGAGALCAKTGTGTCVARRMAQTMRRSVAKPIHVTGFSRGSGLEARDSVISGLPGHRAPSPESRHSVVHIDTPVASFTKMRLPENDGAPHVTDSATL